MEKNKKSQISYSDFAKLDMRVGEIAECEEIKGSEKLLKLTVDLGSEVGKRIILSGIKKLLDPATLVGTQVLVLVNLEPKKMMGLESNGMILMAVERAEGQGESEGREGLETITLLVPQNKVKEGTKVE